MTQSIEEAFRKMQATTAYVASSAGVAAALEDAVRDGYLAVLEQATDLWLEGHFNDSDKLQRRIEELGR